MPAKHGAARPRYCRLALLGERYRVTAADTSVTRLSPGFTSGRAGAIAYGRCEIADASGQGGGQADDPRRPFRSPVRARWGCRRRPQNTRDARTGS